MLVVGCLATNFRLIFHFHLWLPWSQMHRIGWVDQHPIGQIFLREKTSTSYSSSLRSPKWIGAASTPSSSFKFPDPQGLHQHGATPCYQVIATINTAGSHRHHKYFNFLGVPITICLELTAHSLIQFGSSVPRHIIYAKLSRNMAFDPGVCSIRNPLHPWKIWLEALIKIWCQWPMVNDNYMVI